MELDRQQYLGFELQCLERSVKDAAVRQYDCYEPGNADHSRAQPGRLVPYFIDE